MKVTPESSALLGRAEANLRAIAESGAPITLAIATMIASAAKFRAWAEYGVTPNAGELSIASLDLERAASLEAGNGGAAAERKRLHFVVTRHGDGYHIKEGEHLLRSAITSAKGARSILDAFEGGALLAGAAVSSAMPDEVRGARP